MYNTSSHIYLKLIPEYKSEDVPQPVRDTNKIRDSLYHLRNYQFPETMVQAVSFTELYWQLSKSAVALLEKLRVPQLVQNSHFLEPEDLLSCLQQHATDPYPEPQYPLLVFQDPF
jgi:hypothetical protein